MVAVPSGVWSVEFAIPTGETWVDEVEATVATSLVAHVIAWRPPIFTCSWVDNDWWSCTGQRVVFAVTGISTLQGFRVKLTLYSQRGIDDGRPSHVRISIRPIDDALSMSMWEHLPVPEDIASTVRSLALGLLAKWKPPGEMNP